MRRSFSLTVHGSPPVHMLVSHLAQDEDFVGDARRILALSEDSYARLTDALRQSTGFLDRRAVQELASELLGEDGKAVAKVVSRVSSILRDAEEPLEDSFKAFSRVINDTMTTLEPDERAEFCTRIEQLAVVPRGLALQHKSEHLADVLGDELADLQLICDLRPILNAERTEVLGAIPVTTLHLELAGNSTKLDIHLSEEQLKDLCQKVDDARNKLAILKEFSANHNVTIPRTSATLSE
ncbi:MAG: hypothetical protein H6822_31080 [Planctomycetaceae bacterium]|nr:hypothetical protein [Planctomycetales bacterium]MCB9926624.1 hypothetical protein [Planctomycetaceae bacterium]